MSDSVSIKIPKKLADKIKLIADQFGFRSVTEFVLDAVRRRLDIIESSHYPMRLKFTDVCYVIGCGAYSIEVNRMQLNKNLEYWLPLCKHHQLEFERSKK